MERVGEAPAKGVPLEQPGFFYFSIFSCATRGVVCVSIHARNALRTCNPAYFEDSAPSGEIFSNSDPHFGKFGATSPLNPPL